MTAALPKAACIRCTGTDDLILGDAPFPVCNGCVELLTEAADKPYACSERLLTALLSQHPEVKLARTADAGHELVWEWVA